MRRAIYIFLIAQTLHAEELIRVRSHLVATPHTQVTLDQLLDLHDVSQGFKNKVIGVNLAVAPAAGERIELTNSAITSLLRPAVAYEKSTSTSPIKVVVPNKVIIDTVKRSIERAEVEQELLQVWKPLCSDCEIEIKNLAIPKVDNIVDWSLKLKAELPKGVFSIPMEISRENAPMLPAWVNGQISIRKKVPVAKRLISPADRIQLADISLEYVDVTYAMDGVPTMEEVIGKKLRQSVRNSSPIFRSNIDRERAVRRGDAVRISSSAGPWEVAVNMLAEQDAFVGDTVSLKNPKTNKILTGVVVAQGEVELR